MKSTLRERPGQQKPCQRWRSSPSASPRTPQEVAGQTQSASRQEPKQQLEARRALLLHETKTKTKTQGRERPTLRVRPWAPQQEEAGLRLAQDLPATLNTQTGEARRGRRSWSGPAMSPTSLAELESSSLQLLHPLHLSLARPSSFPPSPLVMSSGSWPKQQDGGSKRLK